MECYGPVNRSVWIQDRCLGESAPEGGRPEITGALETGLRNLIPKPRGSTEGCAEGLALSMQDWAAASLYGLGLWPLILSITDQPPSLWFG